MDFTCKPRQRIEIKPEIENLEQLYPHNVMLYKLPPTQEITIQEFEDLALERLKLLRIFEQASTEGLRFMSQDWKDRIIAEIKREELKGYARLFKGGETTSANKKELELQARRKDYISHFILRLAYCRSQDLKRWFITREMEVFRYKFDSLLSKDIKNFIEINKLNYLPITDEEKNEIKNHLFESTTSVNTIDCVDFYKVHWTEVFDLIRGRKCYLRNGYAYVSANDFVSIIAAIQQDEIEKGLNACQRLLPEIENDERLFYLLKGLHTSYTGKDYTVSKGSSVPIEAIDQLAKKSFPLCMRMCHETLRAKHHHKHGGRLQYGLFLKGIGVTLEDSLKFWRQEFTRIMDLEKFEKSYAYNIRHNYGKEGSMTNYTPHSCMKIITSSVGPQDTHGCPFKIYDQSTLKLRLASYGLSAAHVQDVCSYAAKGHYQIACAKYFEIVHDTTLDQGINHPNQYFELSQAIMENREPKTHSSQGSKSGAKSVTRIIKKENKTALIDADDDDELWNIAATQENESGVKTVHSTQVNENTKNEWGDEDFDMSEMEGMEC